MSNIPRMVRYCIPSMKSEMPNAPSSTCHGLPVPEEKAHGQEHQEVQQALHQHLPVSQLREPHQRIQNGDAPHPVAAEQDDEQRYEIGDAQQHQHPPTDPFFQKQVDDGGAANDGQEQEQGTHRHIQKTRRKKQDEYFHEKVVIYQISQNGSG